jgi:hypothetical protein
MIKTLNQIIFFSSGRVPVVQEVLRTLIMAPYRKAILVLCRFCRCVVRTPDPGRQIHIKALTFLNNVCHQGEKNTEKKLARRQPTVKEESSNSY